jgi:hypothetical protein
VGVGEGNHLGTEAEIGRYLVTIPIREKDQGVE